MSDTFLQPMGVLSDYSISPLCTFGTETEQNMPSSVDLYSSSFTLMTKGR